MYISARPCPAVAGVAMFAVLLKLFFIFFGLPSLSMFLKFGPLYGSGALPIGYAM